MDVLRSAYSTMMWGLDPATGLAVQWPVRWMRAPPGATPLGVHHQYASYNWTKGIAYPEQVGEVIGAARLWSNGRSAAGVLGTNHCGTAWTGPLTLLATPQPLNAFDQPTCCNAPPALCLPRVSACPTIDLGDGRGPKPMVPFFAHCGYTDPVNPTYTWAAVAVGPACSGRPLRWRVRLDSTATGNQVVPPFALGRVALPGPTGSFYVPLTSPIRGGITVLVTS